MNKPNLSIIDIYPEMIQDAYGLCEAILTEDYGYTMQDFFKRIQHDLKISKLDDISTRLVRIMFSETAEMIQEKDPNATVDYYINGTLDIHFYINGEEQ